MKNRIIDYYDSKIQPSMEKYPLLSLIGGEVLAGALLLGGVAVIACVGMVPVYFLSQII